MSRQTFCVDGQLHLHHQVLIDAIRADADDEHSDHDMGGHHSRLVSDGMAAVYDFNLNGCPVPRSATTATGATSEPLTRSTTRTWTWCRCIRFSTCTTKRWPIRGESENLAPASL